MIWWWIPPFMTLGILGLVVFGMWLVIAAEDGLETRIPKIGVISAAVALVIGLFLGTASGWGAM